MKPLIPVKGTSSNLPMVEIRRSIEDVVIEISAPQRLEESTEGDVLSAIREVAFAYFSSDQAQRTMKDAIDVATYLFISFDAELEIPVPEHFDWGLIHRLQESQMVAAILLWEIHSANAYEHDAPSFAKALAKGFSAMAALRQAEKHRETVRNGAAAMLANDPRQSAKREVHKLWQERHSGKHPNLRTNEQFAIECMQRWPVLSSSQVIRRWCTEWTKATKAKGIQLAK